MDAQEIRSALLEAAKQSVLGILDREMPLESLMSDLPETEMILSIVRKQLGLGRDEGLPADFTTEQIKAMSETVKASLGEPIAQAFKEVVRQPKLIKAIRTLFAAHSDELDRLDAVLSKRYADILLDFAERYMNTPEWKKTEAFIITAEAMVKNVTGAAKPRLYARMDVTWGIYLWKCGDYSEAEKKFTKASAGVDVLMKKHGKEITEKAEIFKNRELHTRILHGFGVLYGDSLEDKTRAIHYYNECLKALDGLDKTYRNKKMRTSILNNLGVTNHRMAELHPEEAERYLNLSVTNFEEGLASARSIHYTTMEGWILFNAGEIYALLGNLERAEAYSAESRRIFGEHGANERGMSGVEMLDAVICMQRKTYPEALECMERSIALREKLGEPRRIADALEYRGDIWLASGDSAKAMQDFNLANAIYRSIGSETGKKRTDDKIGALR